VLQLDEGNTENLNYIHRAAHGGDGDVESGSGRFSKLA
jgi:hypothetical protein